MQRGSNLVPVINSNNLSTELIFSRMSATLELSIMSALFALFVGIPMGVYTGLNRDSWLSKIFLSVSLVGVSLPTFFIGILFIFLFSVNLQWLPSFGRGEVVLPYGADWTTGLLTIGGLKAIILPASYSRFVSNDFDHAIGAC